MFNALDCSLFSTLNCMLVRWRCGPCSCSPSQEGSCTHLESPSMQWCILFFPEPSSIIFTFVACLVIILHISITSLVVHSHICSFVLCFFLLPCSPLCFLFHRLLEASECLLTTCRQTPPPRCWLLQPITVQ
jgi:hypothetical protein